jgi:hypothetical protein
MDIKQPEAQDLKNLKNYLKLLHLTSSHIGYITYYH